MTLTIDAHAIKAAFLISLFVALNNDGLFMHVPTIAMGNDIEPDTPVPTCLFPIPSTCAPTSLVLANRCCQQWQANMWQWSWMALRSA